MSRALFLASAPDVATATEAATSAGKGSLFGVALPVRHVRRRGSVLGIVFRPANARTVWALQEALPASWGLVAAQETCDEWDAPDDRVRAMLGDVPRSDPT